MILPPDMWRLTRKQDHAADLGGDWAAIVAADRDRKPGQKPSQLILDLPGNILTYIKMTVPARKIDWELLTACKQKQGEAVLDFFTRFEEVFHDFSGQDTSTPTGAHLFVD